MSRIRVANAPCSWGSLEFAALEGEAIGYQQMLDELAATGYAGTELGDFGYMPTDPTLLRAELAKRNLVLTGAFVPAALRQAPAHAQAEAAALKAARLLADVADVSQWSEPPLLVLADDNGTDPTRTNNAGRITAEMGLSNAQWRTFAQGAERIAQAVRQQTGLATVFHHHCAGYVETIDEITRLLELTDPELLGLVLDTGHLVYGAGGDDLDALPKALRRFADRIAYVHFKDCHTEIARRGQSEGWDYFRAVREGVFCEIGQGSVDFRAVLRWLKDRGYEGWVVVEQDVLPGMGTPRHSAQRNRDYLRTLGV